MTKQWHTIEQNFTARCHFCNGTDVWTPGMKDLDGKKVSFSVWWQDFKINHAHVEAGFDGPWFKG